MPYIKATVCESPPPRHFTIGQCYISGGEGIPLIDVNCKLYNCKLYNCKLTLINKKFTFCFHSMIILRCEIVVTLASCALFFLGFDRSKIFEHLYLMQPVSNGVLPGSVSLLIFVWCPYSGSTIDLWQNPTYPVKALETSRSLDCLADF